MIWQETPYTIPFLGLSVLFVGLGIYIWFHYRSPLGRTGAVTILASTEWIISAVLMFAGGDLATKIFWRKMQYPGIIILPVAWFVFAVLYTGREEWLTRRSVAGLSVIPVITLGLAFTNEYHSLMWSNFVLGTSGPFLIIDETFGVWLWGFIGYAYVLLMCGALLFLIHIRTCSRRRYKRQTSILLFGGAVPWAATALSSFGLNPFPHLDLTLVALAMTNGVVAFNIFYFQIGEVALLAREAIIESMIDSVIVLDMENRIIDLNPSAEKLVGNNTADVTGKPIGSVWPECWSMLASDTQGGEIIKDQCIYDVSISSLSDWRDRIVSRVVVLRDVTDRKRTEKIKQSLREKEILLQEIHHRVKNNIQVISSLLNLQSQYTDDKKSKEMFKECQNRIRSMALIHEKLYKSENLADINFNEYITDLVNGLHKSYGINTITVTVEGNAFLGIDSAIPCGLIINELVSNSFKHAFTDGKGEIKIDIHSYTDTVELVVSDNGVGIPDDINFRESKSLGLRLVTILAEDQLNGTISLDRSGGTAFHITFRKKTKT